MSCVRDRLRLFVIGYKLDDSVAGKLFVMSSVVQPHLMELSTQISLVGQMI